jgi:hypothetical protein
LNFYLEKQLSQSLDLDGKTKEICMDFFTASRRFLDCLIENQKVSHQVDQIDAGAIFSECHIPQRLEQLGVSVDGNDR